MSSLKEVKDLLDNLEITERGLFGIYNGELVIMYPFYEPDIKLVKKDNNYKIDISNKYKLSSYIKIESLINNKIYLVPFSNLGLDANNYIEPYVSNKLNDIINDENLLTLEKLKVKRQIVINKYNDLKEYYSLEEIFAELITSMLLEIKFRYLNNKEIDINLIKEYYDYLMIQYPDKISIYNDALETLENNIKEIKNKEVKNIVEDIYLNYDNYDQIN